MSRNVTKSGFATDRYISTIDSFRSPTYRLTMQNKTKGTNQWFKRDALLGKVFLSRAVVAKSSGQGAGWQV
ncbi:hypothetical protein RV420_260098 [Roseovarius sp. EC-SD190]|nr:hypothetical protein RV420_260098 [Roseovarius sp. EC-SD190]